MNYWVQTFQYSVSSTSLALHAQKSTHTEHISKGGKMLGFHVMPFPVQYLKLMVDLQYHLTRHKF